MVLVCKLDLNTVKKKKKASKERERVNEKEVESEREKERDRHVMRKGWAGERTFYSLYPQQSTGQQTKS